MLYSEDKVTPPNLLLKEEERNGLRGGKGELLWSSHFRIACSGSVMKCPRNDPALKQLRKKLRHRQTEVENIFWERVRNRKFFGVKFFRQYSIGSYILDFYCPALKLAVELDGGQHIECKHRKYDDARSEYLQAQRIEVMRFWNHDVLLDIDSVLVKMMERMIFINSNSS